MKPALPDCATGADLLHQLELPPFEDDGRCWWMSVTDAVKRWLHTCRINPLDAVWLVPHASHVQSVQQSWKSTGYIWMPKVESWGARIRRLLLIHPGPTCGLSFNFANDRLIADQLLRGLPWGDALAQQDRRSYAAILTQLVHLAQAMSLHCLHLMPEERQPWEQQARERLSCHGDGVDLSAAPDLEQALALVALEWAVLDTRNLPTIAAQEKKKAWVLLPPCLSGEVPTQWLAWAQTLAQIGHAPVLLMKNRCSDAINIPKWVYEEKSIKACKSLEDEAQKVVGTVAREVNTLRSQGMSASVALIAQDRLLIRRIYALLTEGGYSVWDESGWKLSTSRAASVVIRLLRLCSSHSSSNELIDYLKSQLTWLSEEAQAAARLAVTAIEEQIRHHRWTTSIPPQSAKAIQQWARSLGSAAWVRWTQIQSVSSRLRWKGKISHQQACDRLAAALKAEGLWDGFVTDVAGRALIEQLRLSAEHEASDELSACRYVSTEISFLCFVDWVDAALEDGRFHPQLATTSPPDVVVTSLPQTLWRSFSAWIFPGIDNVHLHDVQARLPLISFSHALELGLMNPDRYSSELRACFASTMGRANVFPFFRVLDNGVPVEVSQLWLDWVHRCGSAPLLSFDAEGDDRPVIHLPARPLRLPQPSLASAVQDLLPVAVSASMYSSLRRCPYQFFVRSVLRLREVEDLEDQIQAKDVGNWLHATLHAYHQADANEEINLITCAKYAASQLGLCEKRMLPHFMWFEEFAQAYLAWLDEQNVLGYRYSHGEQVLSAMPPEIAPLGLSLVGRIDRIDQMDKGGGWRIVDYKTTHAQRLRERLNEGEDVQLPLYIALLAQQAGDTPVEAAYLPLQGFPLKTLQLDPSHSAVTETLSGIYADWNRLRKGFPMLALGEGSACEHCESRRLCRKDYWLNNPSS